MNAAREQVCEGSKPRRGWTAGRGQSPRLPGGLCLARSWPSSPGHLFQDAGPAVPGDRPWALGLCPRAFHPGLHQGVGAKPAHGEGQTEPNLASSCPGPLSPHIAPLGTWGFMSHCTGEKTWLTKGLRDCPRVSQLASNTARIPLGLRGAAGSQPEPHWDCWRLPGTPLPCAPPPRCQHSHP